MKKVRFKKSKYLLILMSSIFISHSYAEDFEDIKDFRYESYRELKIKLIDDNVTALEKYKGSEKELKFTFLKKDFKTNVSVTALQDDVKRTVIELYDLKEINLHDVLNWVRASYGEPHKSISKIRVSDEIENEIHTWDFNDFNISLMYNNFSKRKINILIENKKWN